MMNKKYALGLITGFLLCVFTGWGNAATINAISVTGTDTYNNLGYISDGVFPSEGTNWQTTTTWWMGTTPTFTFDYGQLYSINDILLSVDNNDTYRVEYSIDKADWALLFDLSSAIGNIPSNPGGMDTMSTLYGHPQYQVQIDFSPVLAQYLRISAIGGDTYYSVGEFQVDGTPAPVPEPGTMLLLGVGLLGLAGVNRKK